MTSQRPLILVLAAFVLLAGAYSMVIPLGEASDEVSHWAYVQFLVSEHRLPGSEGPSLGEAHQAPLYYMLEAAATAWIAPPQFQPIANPDFQLDDPQAPNLLLHPKSESFPFSGVALAWHLGRLLSVLIGVATVWATWKIALELVPGQTWFAFGAAAFVAFLPEFLVISAVVSNDGLVVMLSSISILATLRIARRGWGWREAVALGVVLGLTLLAKLSGLVVWVFAGVVLAYVTIKSGRWVQGAQKLLTALSIACGLCAPWLAYNWYYYGDPLAWSRLLLIEPRETALSFDEWVWVLKQLFTSFWGRFGGAVHIRLDDWVYDSLACGLVVALAGWLLYARDAIRRRLERRIIALAAVVGLFSVILLIVDIRWILSASAGDQARQLFPGLPLLSVFLAAGLQRLVGFRNKLTFGATSVAGCAFAVGVLVFLFGVYSPPLVSANGITARSSIVDFGNEIRVLDYQFEPQIASPGQVVTARVYWQALRPMTDNYWLLLQLASKKQVIANRDGVPGAGRLTTDLWQRGQMFVSSHRISIPGDAPEGEITLSLGLHPFGRWEWLPVRGQDMLELGQVTVVTAPQ